MTGSIRNRRVHNPEKGEFENVTVYLLGGREVTREEFDAAFPSKLDELLGGNGVEVMTNTRPGCWPMVSRSMGVLPSQVAEGNADLKKAGVNCHYEKNGGLVIPDQAAKKKVMKHKGTTDLSSFN